jgi:hypothetical protein
MNPQMIKLLTDAKNNLATKQANYESLRLAFNAMPCAANLKPAKKAKVELDQALVVVKFILNSINSK